MLVTEKRRKAADFCGQNFNKMKENNLKTAQHNVVIGILGSLTLGLAPFYPEPHLFGKIRWVLGGAHGVAAMDWFDLAMHGAPVVWLVWALWVWWRVKRVETVSFLS
jgi:hypothetical protein